MKKKIYLILLIILFTGTLAVGLFWQLKNKGHNGIQQLETQEYLKSKPQVETQYSDQNQIENSKIAPAFYLIENVPFQPQAPFANWDELHDEACEEAAVILVYYFLTGQKLTAEKMDGEILKMVDWQMKNWGGHHDLTIEETAEMAEKNFGLKPLIKKEAGFEEIKKEIAAGRPVIVPTAGRLLGNPYYRQPGPIYHMLVIIGYDDKNIIVQDIGTRRGERYKYNTQIFLNAWHDWAGAPDNITAGAKVLLILSLTN